MTPYLFSTELVLCVASQLYTVLFHGRGRVCNVHASVLAFACMLLAPCRTAYRISDDFTIEKARCIASPGANWLDI